MDKEQKLRLAELIVQFIEEDFQTVHFSGNLMDTIYIENLNATEDNENSDIRIVIPAQRYDIAYYMYAKKIVYTHNGSYADAVDIDGGMSGKHKDYTGRAIKKAIDTWLLEQDVEGKVKDSYDNGKT